MNGKYWPRLAVSGLRRWHRPLLGGAALAAVLSGALLIGRGLRQDYRLEAFVASRDDSYLHLRAFVDEFTSNELAVVAVHSPAGFDEAAERALSDLTSRLGAIPAVQRASSLFSLPGSVRALLGERLLSHPLISGSMLSTDRTTAALVLQMRGESGGGVERHRTVAELRRVVAEARSGHPQWEFVLAGPYVTLIDMYDYVDRDVLVFSVLSLVIIAATLGLLFRDGGVMLYAGLVGSAAVLTTLGLAAGLGTVTSLITQMIIVLVIVLAVANCVHLAIAAEEVRAAAPAPAPADGAEVVLGRMIGPCAAAMLTTAAGFGSVCISDIAPVRRFGSLMVFGLLLALVIGLAGVVVLARRPAARSRRGELLGGLLQRAGEISTRRSGTVLLVFAGGMFLIGGGALRLRSESDFVNNFRADSEVRRSYRFIERYLAPLGSLEVVVRGRADSAVLSSELVRRTRQFGERMVQEHALVKRALTPADLLALPSAALPGSDKEVRMRLDLLRALPGGPELVRGFFNAGGDALRINFRCAEGYSVEEKLRVSRAVEEEGRRVFGADYRVEVTGLYPFYAGLVRRLVRDQYRSLGLTVPLVAAVITLLCGSLRFTAIILAVNVAPLVACLGLMGWTGVPVSMTTAMMLSVILGMAVDHALHYVWRYRRELAECGDHAEAIRRTQRSAGRACLFTTVVLAGGFSILLFSRFVPTAHFGGLVGVSMIGALVCGLVLLPALLARFGAAHRARG